MAPSNPSGRASCRLDADKKNHPPSDTFFAPLLGRCPYYQEILAQFDCELEAVRLMRLGAGSVIKEHQDLDLSVEDGVVRLHVPIVTDDDVDFRLNGRAIRMRAGECWYLRLSDPHSVTNRSMTDRVHLVIDARVNDWLRALLARAEATFGASVS